MTTCCTCFTTKARLSRQTLLKQRRTAKGEYWRELAAGLGQADRIAFLLLGNFRIRTNELLNCNFPRG